MSEATIDIRNTTYTTELSVEVRTPRFQVGNVVVFRNHAMKIKAIAGYVWGRFVVNELGVEIKRLDDDRFYELVLPETPDAGIDPLELPIATCGLDVFDREAVAKTETRGA